MIKNLILCLISITLFSLTTLSQKSTILNNGEQYNHGLSTELIYTGSYGMAIGGIIGKNLGNKMKSNFSAAMYSEIIFNNTGSSNSQAIFAPRLKLLYNYASIFGIGLDISNHFRGGIMDARITPGINISLYGISNLSLGYSFNVGGTQFKEIGKFRIALSMNFIKN